MAAQKQAARKPRRRDRKSVPVGQAHIKSTFNNTIISITDPSGAVVSWASGGDVGFKGSRKSTPYAAGMAAESAARKAMEHGVKKVDVFVKGPGSGRETAIDVYKRQVVMVLIMTGGTGLIMWMAELVTDKGLGQGLSLIHI